MEKKSNGLYVLKARNEATGPYSPSAEGQKHVHAFLGGRPIDRQGPIEWAIAEVQSTQNRKGYMCVLRRGFGILRCVADTYLTL